MPRLLIAALLASVLPLAAASAQTPAADLQTNIGRLSSLDYPTRMNAARTIRRLPAAEAVPALVEAVRKHRDEFVRYRAFIVLSSFNDPAPAIWCAVCFGTRTTGSARLPTNGWKRTRTQPWLPTLLSSLQSETGGVRSSGRRVGARRTWR